MQILPSLVNCLSQKLYHSHKGIWQRVPVLTSCSWHTPASLIISDSRFFLRACWTELSAHWIASLSSWRKQPNYKHSELELGSGGGVKDSCLSPACKIDFFCQWEHSSAYISLVCFSSFSMAIKFIQGKLGLSWVNFPPEKMINRWGFARPQLIWLVLYKIQMSPYISPWIIYC